MFFMFYHLLFSAFLFSACNPLFSVDLHIEQCGRCAPSSLEELVNDISTLSQQKKQLLIGIGGPIGCGKTELAEEITSELKLRSISTTTIADFEHVKERVEQVVILDSPFALSHHLSLDIGITVETTVSHHKEIYLEKIKPLQPKADYFIIHSTTNQTFIKRR